ncbi:hypothetical protein ACP70R_041579 [Stipagrostis hirtigluma subsp. patula]
MKRPRNSENSLRRTTSLSELAPPPEQGRQRSRPARGGSAAAPAPTAAMAVGTGWGAVPMQRRHSGDFAVTETAAFLQACGICHRRLGPGRDTFIYMGEVAFCSHECRQQQMNLDELKEKNCFSTASGSGGGSSDQSGKSSTVAAA